MCVTGAALAQPAPATVPARIVCSRCNGANDASMLYCQFCGGALRPEVMKYESTPA